MEWEVEQEVLEALWVELVVDHGRLNWGVQILPRSEKRLSVRDLKAAFAADRG